MAFYTTLEDAVSAATAAKKEFVIEIEARTGGHGWIISEMGIYGLRQEFARRPYSRMAEEIIRLIAEHRVDSPMPMPADAGDWIYEERNRGIRTLNSDF